MLAEAGVAGEQVHQDVARAPHVAAAGQQGLQQEAHTTSLHKSESDLLAHRVQGDSQVTGTARFTASMRLLVQVCTSMRTGESQAAAVVKQAQSSLQIADSKHQRRNLIGRASACGDTGTAVKRMLPTRLYLSCWQSQVRRQGARTSKACDSQAAHLDLARLRVRGGSCDSEVHAAWADVPLSSVGAAAEQLDHVLLDVRRQPRRRALEQLGRHPAHSARVSAILLLAKLQAD